MTSFLVFGIVCGLVFLDDWKEYNWGSGIGIFCGVLLCNFGIALIVLKNAKVAKKTVLNQNDKSNRSDEDELQE